VEAGCPLATFAARPVTGSVCLGDFECCSFSSRIPGVVDSLSKIYVPGRLKNLVELDISDEVAISTARALIRRGFPLGPSSGLNCAAPLEAARRLGPGAQIVTVFPDRMERYFSTDLTRRPAEPTPAAGTSTTAVPFAAAGPRRA